MSGGNNGATGTVISVLAAVLTGLLIYSCRRFGTVNTFVAVVGIGLLIYSCCRFGTVTTILAAVPTGLLIRSFGTVTTVVAVVVIGLLIYGFCRRRTQKKIADETMIAPVAAAAATAAVAGIGLLMYSSLTKKDEGKTMKAPGQNFRIPREKFEENPSRYFRDLRNKM